MKFIRGTIHAGLIAEYHEVDAVRDLLTFDKSKGSFLDFDRTLYSGLVDFVQDILGDLYEIEVVEMDADEAPQLSIKDIKIPDDYLEFDEPDHIVRPYQKIAARKGIFKRRGIIEIATGGGKTEVAAIIMKWLLENDFAKKVYFVAGSRFLMKQAANRFEARGLKDVGRFGGGMKFEPATIQCCVIDSLRESLVEERMGAPGEVLADFNQCDVIFFEECHHLSAVSWIDIGECCPAKYRYGLTATLWSDPFKYSHKDFYLIGLTGGLICHVPSSVLRRHGWLAHPIVTMVQVEAPLVPKLQWDKAYQAGIVRHKTRNSYVLSIAKSLYDGGYKTLTFVKEVNHGLLLVKLLTELGCKNSHFVMGGEKMWTWKPSGRWECRQITIEELAETVRDQDHVTIVGNTVLDEGIDVPSFNALIMGTAMKKYRRSIQRAGRGMRPKKGDNKVYIFDFVDAMNDTLLKHSVYRMQTYELEEYTFSESLEDISKEMKIDLSLDPNLFKFDWVRPNKKRRGSKHRNAS